MLLGVALNRHLFSEIDPAVPASRAGPVVIEVLTRGALATVEEHTPSRG